MTSARTGEGGSHDRQKMGAPPWPAKCDSVRRRDVSEVRAGASVESARSWAANESTFGPRSLVRGHTQQRPPAAARTSARRAAAYQPFLNRPNRPAGSVWNPARIESIPMNTCKPGCVTRDQLQHGTRERQKRDKSNWISGTRESASLHHSRCNSSSRVEKKSPARLLYSTTSLIDLS